MTMIRSVTSLEISATHLRSINTFGNIMSDELAAHLKTSPLSIYNYYFKAKLLFDAEERKTKIQEKKNECVRNN